ncbi:MAG TPA: hypothetical protein VIJ68_01940, partial [Candidatus Saccharimonadales bacterium]
LALALVVVRTGRGLSIRRTYKTAEKRAEYTASMLSSISIDTQQRISGLPEDEPSASDLQTSSDRLGNASLRLVSQREKVGRIYKDEARQIWPNKKNVKTAAGTLTNVATRGNTVLDEGAGVVKNLDTLRFTTEQEVDRFDLAVNEVASEAVGLENDGWELGELNEQAASLAAVSKEAADLIGEGHMKKPKDLLEAHVDAVSDLKQTIIALPERRAAADAEVEQQPNAIKANEGVVAATKSKLTALQRDYDPTCYKDFKTLANDLDTHLTALRSVQDKAAALVGIKSVSAVEESERLAAWFTEIQATIGREAEGLENHTSHLEAIQTNLPDALAKLGSTLQKVHKSAFEKHAADIEDATREAIADLEARFERFTSLKVEIDKPAYLKIQTAIEKYAAEAAELKEQAKTEREEIAGFRRRPPVDIGNIEYVLNELRSLERKHGRPVTNAIGHLLGTTIPKLDMEQDREGLKEQKERVHHLKERMWDGLGAANRAIHAEEKRLHQQEVDRRRRQARAEADAHARAWRETPWPR